MTDSTPAIASCAAVTAGVAELAKRGMPATMFVPPAFVGDGDFWWDAVDVDGDRGAFRELALTVCRGEDAKVRAEAERRGIDTREVPPHARCATAEELRESVEFLGAETEILSARPAPASAKKDAPPPPDPQIQALASLCQSLFSTSRFLYIE